MLAVSRYRRTPFLLFFLLALSSAHAESTVYYSEDENGVARFSDEQGDDAKTYEPQARLTVVDTTRSFLVHNRWKANHEKFRDIIYDKAREYEVDPFIVQALILAESAYNPDAISRVGAQGLMQLMPKTAELYGVTNIRDPEENITGGVKLLRDLIDRYNGNLDLALAAYNAGETAVEKYRGIPPYNETIDYVRKVRKYYSHFVSEQSSAVRFESI